MSVKISVIIPVYNVEKYLRECLDSVINQTLKDIEIICVDDGSTDESGKILDEYAAKDSRVKVIHKQNEGVSLARNQGIMAALGKFVCFMDPDDFYPSDDILESLYANAVQNNVLICGGEFSHFMNEDRTLIQDYKDTFDGYLFSRNEVIQYKDYQFDYGYHRFIYDRKFLVDHDAFFPLYKRFQDVPFFVKAMIEAKKFCALHKITYAYREGHSSVSWNSKKVNHLLQGILDNLNMAHDNDLEKLSMYTAERFKQHYNKIKNSLNLTSFKLIKSMRMINAEVDCFCQQKHVGIYGVYFKSIITNCFSVKNSLDKKHKVLTIFGLKIKFRWSKTNA